MEMDIPDIDELQWLEEANSHLPDHDECYQFHEFDDEDALCGPTKGEHDEFEPASSQPEKESQIQIPSIADNSKKRPRSLSPVPDIADDYRVRVRTETPTPTSTSTPTHSSIDEVHNWSPRDETSNAKYLSRFAFEIDGDCMPVTAPSGSGERVYAKLDKSCNAHVGKFKMPPASSGLIAEPISVLLQKAEQDALMKALQNSAEVSDNMFQNPENSVMTEELWVNKYTPKSFTELLSDEHTNREVLFWLKQWDSTVFGTDIRNTEDEVLCALRRHSSLPHNQKVTGTKFMKKSWGHRSTENNTGQSAMIEQENIKHKGIPGQQTRKLNGLGPPDQKVLLLCGPPGLGKTTLAHVAAKHCGYHVVEINASDDRSSTSIEAKVLDAVQMNSVMSSSKPKCLVIDEIDGALGEGKGAVEVILNMVAADRNSYAGKETSTEEELSGRKSSKNRRKSMALLRPVICICNDLYAPSLRPLRLVAKVHVFPQPSVSRMVSRLKYICNKEGLKTNSIALSALAEYTECDIRSCLNTLQFVHKKKQSLDLAALSSQIIGQKDMTKSIFDVWKEVFQKRKMKQSAKHHQSLNETGDASDFLYSMISCRGDFDLINDGIHENFLRLHFHDPMLQKTVNCLNALGTSDLIQSCVKRSYNMSLYAYHAPLTIMIHRLLARPERPTIEWPRSFQRYRTLMMEKMEVLKFWQIKMAPFISRHLSANTFVEDTVSPLLHILSPADLRPVALNLLTEKERINLAQLVSTMVDYSLTYRHKKSDPLPNHPRSDEAIASTSLCLEPPIQDFINFKGYKLGHLELKSAVKQVIMHEVEKQNIVRESMGRSTQSLETEKIAANHKENGAGCSLKLHKTARNDIGVEKSNNMSEKVISKADSHKSSSTPGSAGNMKKPAIRSVNFFDRFKRLSKNGVRNVDGITEKLATAERDVHPLLFKFNEGFTNAVKRPVRIREFMS